MSFPAYIDCHDTGTPGIRDLPTHWELKRLKDVASHNDDALGDDTPEEADFLYVDISSVNTQQGIHTKEEVVFKNAPSRARRRVQEGDVIVSTVRTYLKAIARVIEPEENLIVSTGFAVVRPGEQLDPGFAGFLLLSNYFIDEVISRSTGVSYPAINASDLVRIHVPIPPLDEQKAISSFLDVETSKIDGLVSEQRRLIELLKEKRQAVISHAVTKGLNPNAPMKPSGIQWLGDVPEHWQVVALKYLASLKSGDGITGESIEEAGDYPVFGGNGLRGFTDAFTHDGHYVIIGRQGALCGNVNYGDGKFWASEHAVVAAPTRNLDTVWLGEMIRSMNLNQYSETAAQPGLSMVAVGNLRTVLPPIEEQREIANFVGKKTTEFDALSAEAERAIELLQERRTALISAAVTGKIDVREFSDQETT